MPYPDGMNFDEITEHTACSVCGVAIPGDQDDDGAVCRKCRDHDEC